MVSFIIKNYLSHLRISCLLSFALLVQSFIPVSAALPDNSLPCAAVTDSSACVSGTASRVIGSGDDPLSKAINAGVSKAVTWSAAKYPEQTTAVLGVLDAAADAIDATITYVDDATGNIVSKHWNQIPEHTRNQIKGGVSVASIMIPAGSVKALGKLKKTGKLPGGKNRAGKGRIIKSGSELRIHENAGGHLIERHVGKTDTDLLARLNSQSNITAASSFSDITTAERAISSALDANSSIIDNFLHGDTNRLVINYNVGNDVGKVIKRGSTVSVPASNIRVILQRDASMSMGYRIVTGFPTLR